MDLGKQLASLRSWLPLLILCAVLSGATAFLVSGILAKSYEAQSKLIVGQSLSAVNPDFSQLMASQRLSSTYALLVTTRPILENVIATLHLDDTPDELARRVAASVGTDSTILTITATDGDPSSAAAIANELGTELIKASPDLQGQEADIQAFVAEDLQATQVQIEDTQAEIARLSSISKRTTAEETQLNLLQDRLTTLRSSYASLLTFASNDASNLLSVVEPAVAPTSPVSPRPLLNALLASLLSVLLFAGAIVIASYFDRRLKDSEDVQEVVGVSTLGTIPLMRGRRGRQEMYQLAMLLYPRSAAAEAYRSLRANLEFSSVDAPVKTLLVTSAGPGEGKTVTAANLAVAFAQTGQQVLLLDADLRKPGVQAMFNVSNDRGLSTLLRSDDALWEHSIRVSEQPNLRLLTTGPLPPNPAELLGTKRMQSILQRLSKSYDLLIIDSPPLLVVADSAILSSFVDGTLLVIDAKATRRDSARAARDALNRAGARVLGVLLNGLPSKDFASYGEYYGADGTTQEQPAVSPEPSRPGTVR